MSGKWLFVQELSRYTSGSHKELQKNCYIGAYQRTYFFLIAYRPSVLYFKMQNHKLYFKMRAPTLGFCISCRLRWTPEQAPLPSASRVSVHCLSFTDCNGWPIWRKRVGLIFHTECLIYLRYNYNAYRYSQAMFYFSIRADNVFCSVYLPLFS